MQHILEQQLQKDEEERRLAEEAKKEQERQMAKAEENAKRSAAYAALNVPADAERYLDLVEYREFADSIPGAIDAYLSEGESYYLDSRVIQYTFFRDKIEFRRQEEQKKIAAMRKAVAYNRDLNTEIGKVRSLLSPRRQDPEKCFEKKAADIRYTGHCLTGLLPEDEKRSLDDRVGKIVNEKLNKLIAADFHEFFAWKYSTNYFPLPFAEYYSATGPCSADAWAW